MRRYKCTRCTWEGDKPKTLMMDWIGFAVCPKCGGRPVEQEEWLEQYRKQFANKEE